MVTKGGRMKDSQQKIEDEGKAVSSPLVTDHIGIKLADLRKKQGLSTHDVSSKIKISEAFISKIEENNVEHIPSVFLKDYIKDYAKIVGMDMDECENYLRANKSHPYELKMKNYSHFEKTKKKGKRFFLLAFLLILILVGAVTIYQYQSKASDSNAYEVTHYIAEPPPSLLST